MRDTQHHTPSALRYSDELFAPEDELLQRVRHAGESLHAGMMVSAYEGKMLHLFAQMIGAKRILEIGTFVGYSTLWMARALPDDGSLITLEYQAEHAALARDFFAQDTVAGTKITLMEGAALTSLTQIAATITEPFDLIFIDAAKGEYYDYLMSCEPMLRAGGLIIGDNSLLFGAMHGEPRQRASAKAITSMQAFNQHLAKQSLFTSVLIPTPEGMTVALKKPQNS
jgi:predicted O-methyltransferase YrrM